MLPTELTSLLTDVTRFFEPPRTPLLLRLVKHTRQRLAYPLVPFPLAQALSKNHLYARIYIYSTYIYIIDIHIIYMYTHIHCYTRSFEGGRGEIGFRFRCGACAGRGERGRFSNLEPLDLNEIVSYVTTEWFALRNVRGKRAITRLSFGRRFLIPPALTLISR